MQTYFCVLAQQARHTVIHSHSFASNWARRLSSVSHLLVLYIRDASKPSCAFDVPPLNELIKMLYLCSGEHEICSINYRKPLRLAHRSMQTPLGVHSACICPQLIPEALPLTLQVELMALRHFFSQKPKSLCDSGSATIYSCRLEILWNEKH